MSWAEEQDWFGLEDLILEGSGIYRESEKPIVRNTLQWKFNQGIWMMGNGKPIRVSEMSDTHIINCIRMIEEGRLDRPWALEGLRKELNKRMA